MSETIRLASEKIQASNVEYYEAVMGHNRFQVSEYKAQIWRPRSKAVFEAASHFIKYADNLKMELSDKEMKEGSSQGGYAGMKADSLYGEVIKYRHLALSAYDTAGFAENPVASANINSERLAFGRKFSHLLMVALPDSLRTDSIKVRWQRTYFPGTSPELAVVMISKLQLDVLMLTNDVMRFCLDWSRSWGQYHAGIKSLAILSSSYVKEGQSIEVTAGLGELTYAARPKITIAGIVRKLDDDGAAVYSFRAKGKPGKYVVPVTISFTKPDGSEATVTKKLEYTIAE